MLNKNKNYINIILFFIIINYENLYNVLELVALNQNGIDLELITAIVEKFLNPNNNPVLNQNEKMISEYWGEKLLCPFSKLISQGLTKEEALLIIEFFKIETIEDLNKLKKWLKYK
jgi:hypothetical protein